MQTVFNILSSKIIKVVFGGAMIAGAAILFFLGDISLFPFIAAGLGLLVMLLGLANVNNLVFYILTLSLNYLLISSYYESFIKSYRLSITVPADSSQFYFITSNKNLKWTDVFLTWLTPNEIKIGFLNNKPTALLNRGIPNNLRIDHKNLYNKGYTLSIIKERTRDYEHIVLLPLNKGRINLIKGNLGDFYYYQVKRRNYSLNEKIIERKLDSINRYGIY